MNAISNTDNILDSRDIIARMEELQGEKESLEEAVEEKQEAVNDAVSIFEASKDEEDASYIQDEKEREASQERLEEDLEDSRMELEDAQKELTDWLDDNKEELAILEGLNEQGEGYGDWSHGETLIHESYFTDYAQELVSDIGDMPREIPDYIVIDWEATAENLKADYTTIDFDGETYYMRSC